MKDIQKWIVFIIVLIIDCLNVTSFPSEKIVHIYNIPPVDYSKADAVESDITYQLFTNKNISGVYVTKESAPNIVNIDIPTKFVIHGWLSNETTYWYGPYRDECFKKGDYNIIYIDWSKAGSKEFYVSAANCKPIGGYIADFIISAKLKLDKVHIIAHSLGSQVAGFIGKRIYEETGSKLARITCTDPAGPAFENPKVNDTDRVTSADAEFVDVIHTDIGHYGYIEAIGHVDFYPNGGTLQPGCPSYEEDGTIIGEFIVHHQKSSSINLNNVHVIGHSLGAHVAGAVGETVYRLLRTKIGRITGLDPAGPLFQDPFAIAKKRLGKKDAKMVDIVHTDDGLFGCAGLKGTVNFYPNGGTALQPGCSLRVTLQDVLEAIKTIFVEPLPKVFCSHRKSVAFYIKSINEKNLTAYKCPSSKSYAKMQCNDKNGIPFGEDTPPNASGNYYIKIIK